jgi:hypothetical protein
MPTVTDQLAADDPLALRLGTLMELRKPERTESGAERRDDVDRVEARTERAGIGRMAHTAAAWPKPNMQHGIARSHGLEPT